MEIQMDNQRFRGEQVLQLMNTLRTSACPADVAIAGEQLLSTYRSLLSHSELYGAYVNTSDAFAATGDHRRSVQFANMSVSHWRTVASQDKDGLYVAFVAFSVSHLASKLRFAEDYEQAFIESHQALELYSSLTPRHPILLRQWMNMLDLSMSIAREKEEESKSLERSREIVCYSRALVKQFPSQQPFLIRRILDHALMLEDFDHLADAAAAIQEAIDWSDEHPAQDSDSAELQTDCLLYYARFLRFQGHPDKASSVYEKAVTIGQPFVDAYPVAQNILWAKALNLFTLYDMGHFSLALPEINACLKFASEHDLKKDAAYTQYLDITSRIYRCCAKVDTALPTIRLSLTLQRERGDTPFSWILSDLLADTVEDDEALTVAHDAIREMEKWKNSSKTTKKELYVQAQFSLAIRLFADTAKLPQAQELLVQVQSFYRQYSKAINLWFVKLAITLWAMGHLECASGRHEEGMAARTELNELRKRLRLVFPSLEDLVEVGLNREKNFPAWKNILKKYNLTCGHQDED